MSAQKKQFETDELTHTDIKELFCNLVNIVEPNHPYHNNIYPLECHQIDYGYKQHSSPLYASCGPRRNAFQPVSFKADKSSFNNFDQNRILALYVHELTHITVGHHSKDEHGGHPPRFFREYGFYAHKILENWEDVSELFPNATPEGFIGEIVSGELNNSNIDKRYGSLKDRRHEMAKWFKNTLKYWD